MPIDSFVHLVSRVRSLPRKSRAYFCLFRSPTSYPTFCASPPSLQASARRTQHLSAEAEKETSFFLSDRWRSLDAFTIGRSSPFSCCFWSFYFRSRPPRSKRRAPEMTPSTWLAPPSSTGSATREVIPTSASASSSMLRPVPNRPRCRRRRRRGRGEDEAKKKAIAAAAPCVARSRPGTSPRAKSSSGSLPT